MITIAILAGVALVPTPVAAQAMGGGCLQECDGAGVTDQETEEVRAIAVEWGDAGSGRAQVAGSVPEWLKQCRFEKEPLLADGTRPPDGWTGETVENWVVYCPAHIIAKIGAGVVISDVLTVWPVGDAPPPGLIRVLIRDAYAATPVLAFHPSADPAGTVDIPMIVRHPTALFVDAAEWVPVSATASIPPLSVTTVARPVEATWSGGDDPSSITCDGPGVRIDLDADWEDQDLSCSMMFLHSTAVEDYELAVSVVRRPGFGGGIDFTERWSYASTEEVSG